MRSNLTVNITQGYLSQIPIKETSERDQQPLIKLVDKIISIANKSDHTKNKERQNEVKKLQKEINAMVYKLYGLTSKEIKIVEDFIFTRE